jgi:hypothetical protein
VARLVKETNDAHSKLFLHRELEEVDGGAARGERALGMEKGGQCY